MKIYMSLPDLSYIFFSEAKIVDSLGYMSSNKKILYILKEGEKITEIEKEMSSLFSDFIIQTKVRSHPVDISLDDRMDYINYIKGARGLREAKDLEKKIKSLSDPDFEKFIKFSFVLRRWYKEIFGSYEKVYNLFSAMMKSKKEFLQLYVELRKNHSEQEIFASVLTFFSRVKDYEEQKETLSDFYREILRLARSQSMEIKQSLEKVASLPQDIPVENRVLGFYLSMKA